MIFAVSIAVGLFIVGHSWLVMIIGLLSGSVPLGWIGIIDFALIVSLTVWLKLGIKAPVQLPTGIEDEDSRAKRILAWIAIPVLFLLFALILFNALFFPLSGDDAITIYGFWGARIASTAHLPVGGLYEAYPPLIQLWHATIFTLFGWRNDFVARLIPTLCALLMIPAAYWIGTAWRGRMTGIIAALGVAGTAMFAHWSSTGYTDLPAGGFVALMIALLVQGLRDSEHNARNVPTRVPGSLFLAGIFAGGAALTKNSALLILPGVGLYFALSLVLGYARRAKIVRDGLLFAFGALLVAVPWYSYTLLTSGVIIPPTGWIWAAQRTLQNLFPYLLDTRFAPLNLLYTVGVIALISTIILQSVRFSRGSHEQPDQTVVLLACIYMPFFAAWWLFASYDVRFLLVVQCIPAVLAAVVVTDIVAKSRRIGRTGMIAAGMALFAVGTGSAFWNALDYKTEIVAWLRTGTPNLADSETRRAVATHNASVWRLWREGLPSARIGVQDPQLIWHMDAVNDPHVQIVSREQIPALIESGALDFFIGNPDQVDLIGLSAVPNMNFGGYHVYKMPVIAN